MHPTKTKIVYCKDQRRQGKYPNVMFDFLGYQYRPRRVANTQQDEFFCGYTPAVSPAALKTMRATAPQPSTRVKRIAGHGTSNEPEHRQQQNREHNSGDRGGSRRSQPGVCQTRRLRIHRRLHVSRPNTARQALQIAPCVFLRHSGNLVKDAVDGIVIDDFQAELEALSHYRARAGGRQFNAITLLFPGLDRALSGLSPDPVSIDDKTRTVEVRKLGKSDLIVFLGEHTTAQVRVRRPCAGKIESSGARRQHHRRCEQRGGKRGKPVKKTHRMSPFCYGL
jgi:hypothetical protein